MTLSVCVGVYVCVHTRHKRIFISPFFLSRWAGNKARQKMRQGWWLIRWLVTGMAILSLMTHSWGQDTEGRNSQHCGEPPQASPCSFTSSCMAKMKLKLCGEKGDVSLLEKQHDEKDKEKHNSTNLMLCQIDCLFANCCSMDLQSKSEMTF